MENDELLQRFLRRYDKPATVDAYPRDLQQFTQFVGKPLSEITAHDVAAFRSYLTFAEWRRVTQHGHYSPTSTGRKLDVVRRFIRWAVGEGVSSIGEVELQAVTATDRRVHNAARRHRRRRPT